MRRGLVITMAVAMAGAFGAPAPASAGGFEFPGAGTRSLGRGGAFYARADDPMALLYNPANLAALPDMQLSLNVSIGLWNACVTRSGTFTDYESTPANDPDGLGPFNRIQSGYVNGPGTDSRFNSTWVPGGPNGTDGDYDNDLGMFEFSGVAMPEVCNEGPPGLVPELVYSWRVNEDIGLAVGVLAPNAVGHTQWGSMTAGQEGIISFAGSPTGDIASPLRYQLIEENLLLAFPTIGIGYQVTDWMRIGAGFGFGFAIADFVNISQPFGGEQMRTDILSEMHAVDKFVPRVNASVHFIPHENIDVMTGFMWTDDIKADAELNLSSNHYFDSPTEELHIPGARLVAPQPWNINVGFRYADRIRPRDEAAPEGQIDDPMANERWDIEVDVVYERNSEVESFDIAVPDDPNNPGNPYQVAVDVDSMGNPDLRLPVPNTITRPHYWKDQVSIRVGGDYNFLPDRLAGRLGFSFESQGVEDGYQQIDFMPFMRFGVHAGLTARWRRTDFSIAYAHFFQQTQTVGDDVAAVPQVIAADALRGETIVNAGTYKSSMDMVSFAVNYHFDAGWSRSPTPAASEPAPPPEPEPFPSSEPSPSGEPDYSAGGAGDFSAPAAD